MAQYIHRRNIRFKKEIALADKSKILGVAIDSSANFHRVVIFNFLGKMIGRPFSVDVRQKGFAALVRRINSAQKRICAEKVWIALESSGQYSENLFCHLRDMYGSVVLINALAVANNRKQKSLRNIKTDGIDCGSIGDLLIRGEFDELRRELEVYSQLRSLTNWREGKKDLTIMLKHQISARLKYVYPGLQSDYGADVRMSDTFPQTLLYRGVLSNPMTAQKFLEASDESLHDSFGFKGFERFKNEMKLFRRVLKRMLLPEEAHIKVHISLLKRDFDLLQAIEEEIQLVEEEIIRLGKQTPAKYLMGQIKGVSDLYAGMYIGLVGDIRKYKSARQIFAKSGLAPKIQQSGDTSPRLGITRAGNRLLRALLFKMARSVISNEPFFKAYYHRLREEKKRFWKKNYIAVSRRLNNVLFALMRDKSEYRRISAVGSSTIPVGEEACTIDERSLVTK